MRFHLIFWMLLLAQPVNSAGLFGTPEILPVAEAFELTVVREQQSLALLFRIEPGYYLYKHRMAVSGSDRIGDLVLPAGIEKTDEFFGDVEIYYENLEVTAPFEPGEEVTVIIEYQGCASVGVCYPPQKIPYTL